MTNILELLKHEKVEWKKLGEVCEFKRGNTITKKNAVEGDVPVIAGGQKPAYYHNISNREGITITVAGSGAYAGYVSYWNQPIFLSDAFSIETNSKLDKRYLYHWLLDNQYKIYELKKGSGVPHVYSNDLANFEIPIPSIEIQKKIVDILDNFTNYVTELQSELQSRAKQYTYYRDMLLSEEYLNKVTKKMEEDRKLKIYKLEEIFDFKNGLNKGKEFFGTGVPFISYVNVYKLDRLQKEDITEKVNVTESELERFSIEKGDVLFTRTSELQEEVGYSSVVIEELENCVFNGFSIRARPKIKDLLLPEYCAHLFRCYDIRKEIVKRSSFTTRASLSSQGLGKIKVVIPPLSLQNKIVKILDKFQVMLADTKGLLPEEIVQRQKQYEYYREKLLTFDKYCDSTHARTLILSNHYYEILHEVARFIQIDIGDKVEKKMLKDIGEFINGSGMPKTTFDEKGEVGAIHYGHIYTNYNLFVISPIVKVNKEISERLKKVNYGDIVIAKTSENIEDIMKSVAYLGKEEAVVGGHAAVYKHKQNPKYLSYVFNGSIELIKQKNRLARGVKVIEISPTEMGKIVIPLPPLHVQQHIVSILDKFDTLVNDIKEGLPKEIELRQKQYEYWREQLLSFNR